MPKTWYVSASGTGDGTSADRASGDIMKIQQSVGPGDKLLLHGGDIIDTSQWPYPVISRTACHGAYIGVYDGTQVILRFAGADCITFLRSDNIIIASGINIEDPTRDPTRPGFNPKKTGYNGIHLNGCNNPTIGDANGDVNIRWTLNGISSEVSADPVTKQWIPVRPGIVTRLRVRENWNQLAQGGGMQGQGVFMMGMNGWLFDHCEFDTCGWHPLIPGSATQYQHGIYSHHLDGISGPYTARYCLFRLCASSGPTADSGCELDHCTIWNCSNVPANQNGAGAFQGWGGGAYSLIHHTTVFGKGNGLSMLSPSGDLHDNMVFWDGLNAPLGVDLQNGGAVKQRDATMKVNVINNLIVVPFGAITPPNWNPVWTGKGGPSVVTTPNRVVMA